MFSVFNTLNITMIIIYTGHIYSPLAVTIDRAGNGLFLERVIQSLINLQGFIVQTYRFLKIYYTPYKFTKHTIKVLKYNILGNLKLILYFCFV